MQSGAKKFYQVGKQNFPKMEKKYALGLALRCNKVSHTFDSCEGLLGKAGTSLFSILVSFKEKNRELYKIHNKMKKKKANGQQSKILIEHTLDKLKKLDSMLEDIEKDFDEIEIVLLKLQKEHKEK